MLLLYYIFTIHVWFDFFSLLCSVIWSALPFHISTLLYLIEYYYYLQRECYVTILTLHHIIVYFGKSYSIVVPYRLQVNCAVYSWIGTTVWFILKSWLLFIRKCRSIISWPWFMHIVLKLRLLSILMLSVLCAWLGLLYI